MNPTLPQASQNLLSTMARQAEDNWKTFTDTVNGQVLVSSDEVPVAERIKTAFIFGDIMAQTSSVASFIQEGLNAHLLPHRRIVWKTLEQLQMEVGEEKKGLVFVHQLSDGKFAISLGEVSSHEPHPELVAGETDGAPGTYRVEYRFLDEEGRNIRKVVAWAPVSALVATFIH